MQFDPRSVARDIPGVLDELLPQLTPGIVAHFNNHAAYVPIRPVRSELLLQSQLQRAMLFELGYTVGEHLILGNTTIDWPACVDEAVRRQRVYFDASVPSALTDLDQSLAETIGRNLAGALVTISQKRGEAIAIRPRIPGLEWIGTGYGDFAVGETLIEVKCTAKRFSSADYRQVAIYWLLSYAASVEGGGAEWNDFILLNPRSGEKVSMTFDGFLSIVGSGRTRVELLQLFQVMVGSRLTR